MTSPALTISSRAQLREAIRFMLNRRVSGLPVVDDDGNLVGVISEGDLLHRTELGTEKHRPRWLELLLGPGRGASDYVQSHSRCVEDVMTRDPICIDEEASLEDVVTLMEKRRIKRLPVIRSGKLAGIVTRSDLLRALMQASVQTSITTQTDEDIKQDVSAAIEAEKWTAPGSIRIEVVNGHVTLSGTIFDERERDAIRVCAQNRPGVTGVTDEMIWIDPTSGSFMGPTPI
jgi:CBS domain-containing protein